MLKAVSIFVLFFFGGTAFMTSQAAETSPVTVKQIALSETYPQYTRIRLNGNVVALGCDRDDAVLLDRNSAIYQDFFSTTLTAKSANLSIVVATTGGCATFNGQQVAIAKVIYLN
ncbi:MAG: hypothetical protein AAF642_04945 [Pseudomonadota bacterium]